MNSATIGVEHVNYGFRWRDEHPIEGSVAVMGSTEMWYPFDSAQIVSSAELCGAIVRRHGIKPRWVVAHSDIAIGRKSDPGPLFPWRTFAEAGAGLWVPPGGEHGDAAVLMDETGTEARRLLSRIGYCVEPPAGATGSAGDFLRLAVKAFQLHWRPSNVSGDADTETLATMCAVAAAFEV